MSKGFFISLEGIRGAGKTSQSELLHRYFSARDILVCLTKGIGGTTFARKIRDAMLNESINELTELLSVLADRSDHLEKIIKPNLDNNAVVICDRFIDSTAVYQTRFVNDDKCIEAYDKIYKLHEKFFGNILPDLTILLRGNTSLLCKRVMQRNRIKDRQDFDQKMHRKLQSKFNQLHKLYSDRIHIIDFTEECTPEMIHRRIMEKVIPILIAKNSTIL